eukprot:63214_1
MSEVAVDSNVAVTGTENVNETNGEFEVLEQPGADLKISEKGGAVEGRGTNVGDSDVEMVDMTIEETQKPTPSPEKALIQTESITDKVRPLPDGDVDTGTTDDVTPNGIGTTVEVDPIETPTAEVQDVESLSEDKKIEPSVADSTQEPGDKMDIAEISPVESDVVVTQPSTMDISKDSVDESSLVPEYISNGQTKVSVDDDAMDEGTDSGDEIPSQSEPQPKVAAGAIPVVDLSKDEVPVEKSVSPERAIRSKDAGGGLKVIDIVNLSKTDEESGPFVPSVADENIWLSDKPDRVLKVYSKPRIYELGCRLLRHNGIRSLLLQEIDGDSVLTAFVSNDITSPPCPEEFRNVKITMRGGYVIGCACDCSYTDILWCAHSVATLLAWNRKRDSATTDKVVDTCPMITVKQLRALTGKKKKADLMKLLVDFSLNVPGLAEKLLARLQGVPEASVESSDSTEMADEETSESVPTRCQLDTPMFTHKLTYAFERSVERLHHSRRNRSTRHGARSSSSQAVHLSKSPRARAPSITKSDSGSTSKTSADSSAGVSPPTAVVKSSDSTKQVVTDGPIQVSETVMEDAEGKEDSVNNSVEPKVKGVDADCAFLKDCCGCFCHKILKRFDLSDRQCDLCQGFHRRASSSSSLDNVVDEALEVVEKLVSLGVYSVAEMKNALDLLQAVSKPILSALAKDTKYDHISRSGIRRISKNVSIVFRKIFLSEILTKEMYTSFFGILSEWKKAFPGNTFADAGGEGWFGEKIVNVLSGDPATLGDFNEASVVRAIRILMLMNAKRYRECLFYACAVGERRSIAKCLAYLGRVDEALKVASTEIIRLSDTLEFVKIFTKAEDAKAFKFLSGRFLAELKQPKHRRSSTRESSVLTLLLELADEQHEEHATIIEKIARNYSSDPEKLLKLATSIKDAGLKTSAAKVVMRALDPAFRPSASDLKKAVHLAVCLGDPLTSDAVKQIIKVLKYEHKICAKVDPIMTILIDAGYVNDAFSVGSHGIQLVVKQLTSKRIQTSQITAEDREFIKRMAGLAVSCGTARETKMEQVLESAASFKDPQLLFQLSKTLSDSKLFDIALEYGQKALLMQISQSRREAVIRDIVRWLLRTARIAETPQPASTDSKEAEIVPADVPMEDVEGDEKAAESDEKAAEGGESDQKGDEDVAMAVTEEKPAESAPPVAKRKIVLKVPSIVGHICASLKRAGPHALLPLLDVANFLFEYDSSNVNSAFKIASLAFSLGFTKESEGAKECIRFCDLATEKKHIQFARMFARALLSAWPSVENFTRVASTYYDQGAEWGVRRTQLLGRLTRPPDKDQKKERTEAAESSCSIVDILMYEEVDTSQIGQFVRQEIQAFVSPSSSVELLLYILRRLTKIPLGDRRKRIAEMWIGVFHYNIIIAVLNGLDNSQQMEFLDQIDMIFSKYKVKAAEALAIALEVVARKRSKYITSREKVEEFIQFLKHCAPIFAKADKDPSWNEILTFCRTQNKHRLWFTEPFDIWNNTVTVKIKSDMVVIDE